MAIRIGPGIAPERQKEFMDMCKSGCFKDKVL